MKYFKKLEGKQVYLSPINLEDCETYTRWINDLNTTVRLGNASATISLYSEKAFLENMVKEQNQFAIIKKEDDQLLGNCGLLEVNHIHNTSKVGLFIGEDANRGKGYGTEALSLLLSYSFKVLNLNNIMLQVFAFNENAIGAYKKLGFREIGKRSQSYLLDGTYYDEIYMEILAKDFKGPQIFDL